VCGVGVGVEGCFGLVVEVGLSMGGGVCVLVWVGGVLGVVGGGCGGGNPPGGVFGGVNRGCLFSWCGFLRLGGGLSRKGF